MATDDKETLTIRLPRGLKDLVDKAAVDRETTVTSLVREALQEHLSPVVRMYEHPGLTKRFDEFLAKVGTNRVVLLVAEEGTTRRYAVSGTLARDLCNDSLVAIHRPRDTPWIIPRCDVVAWYQGELQQPLSEALSRQGWATRSAA